MATIGELRRTRDCVSRRLRRARRLYRHLIRRDLLFGGDDMLVRVVGRAKEAGLYAKSTYGCDVAYSFVSTLYRQYHGRGLSAAHWARWANGHFPLWWSRNTVYRRRLAVA